MKTTLGLLLCMLTAEGMLSAQATWKGLRFGMSEDEVRKTYSGTLRKEFTDQHETVLVDDNLELLGAGLSVPAKARLSLGKAGKLEVINLVAEKPFDTEKDQKAASGASL